MAVVTSLLGKSRFQQMAEKVARKPVFLFLLFWTVLNLLQANFTELTSDEGYYWFYAQHLQWGYYDHPPMVATLIKLGSHLFPGELGVRFFNVALSTAGLALFFSLLPEAYKHKSKTYFVVLSAPLLHYLTFLVFPDGPLLFFSLLFLVVYKHFLQERTFKISVLLGLSIALMAYSKYHGALVLFFTVLANPKLLKSGYFYLALFIAALLFAPHLWWQYKQNFPTIKYHLNGRTGQWSFGHVGEYVSQQLAAIGPGMIFLPIVCKAKDSFERTLKFIVVGTFIFFLLSSFKTFVHFHWTSISLYPLLYFAIDYYNDPQKRNLFRWLILPFVLLFLLARLLLMVPLLQGMHVGEDYYHGRKGWAKEIAAVAGSKPVFMPNNLREASLYSFYSGKMGVTLYNRPEKKSQYELWGYEDSLQGKEVLLVTKYPFNGSKPLPNGLHQNLNYVDIPFFTSYYSDISIDGNLKRQLPDTLEAEVEISNNRSTVIDLSRGLNNKPVFLIASFEHKGQTVQTSVLYQFSSGDFIAPKTSIKRHVNISINGLTSKEYKLFFGIRNGVLPDAFLPKEMPFKIRP